MPSNSHDDSVTTWSIRPLAAEDDQELGRLVALEKKAFAAFSTEHTRSNWSLEQFQEELQKPYSHVWVLTDDETDEILAGHIVFWIMGDKDGDAQILNVAVEPKLRRAGFGRMLVQAAVREAMRRGCKKVMLDVRKSNQPAIQLYHSCRFAISALRKGFYSNGEDAYTMTLDLTNEEVKNELDQDVEIV